jgi:hypothetical protein
MASQTFHTSAEFANILTAQANQINVNEFLVIERYIISMENYGKHLKMKQK